MIIVIAALFALVIFELAAGVVVITRHVRRQRDTSAQRLGEDCEAAKGALPSGSVWTALDDLQLTRLLQDSAPR